MADRYLKQVIVIRKDLAMPHGKIAAMVAHASMSFMACRLQRQCDHPEVPVNQRCRMLFECSPDEVQWLTELDPGLDDLHQLSFAKIVLEVKSEAELLAIESSALSAGLTTHRVVDSGYSHNPARTLTCIAIGPHWPEQLQPITGHLKVYR